MATPRGIRNNNPGNIRHGANWLGLSFTQGDEEFCQFTRPEYGIRALRVLLCNYKKLYGIDTIRGIISRYAPTIENDTAAYVKSVSAAVGKGADDPLDLDAEHVMAPLVRAIIRHENGACPYDAETILAGIRMK